ncbi:histidine phosphatase superfamily [Kockiozyma suomiensis]|uniref:histidine phosphatase superfamily n=1 Tax=Kockiozyma suomiensis TaxID=1337062 RepID=UPI003343BFF1
MADKAGANNGVYDPLLHDGQPAQPRSSSDGEANDTSSTASQNGSNVDLEADLQAVAAEQLAPTATTEAAPTRFRRTRSSGTEPALKKLIVILIVPAVLLFMVFFFISHRSRTPSRDASPIAAPTGISFASGFNMKQSWGSLSPYYETGKAWPGISENAGKGYYGLPHAQCSFKQVHVLHRHAERYPTGGAFEKINEMAEKLYNITEKPADELSWISDWRQTMSDELLLASGVATEFTSGSLFWETHGRLLFNATEKEEMFYHPSLNVYPNGTARPKIVLRTTDQSRINTSAHAWAAGFFGVYSGEPNAPVDNDDLYKMVYMSEKPLENNTLASYYSCPNSQSKRFTIGSRIYREWVSIFLKDAAERLNKLLPTANLTPMDTYSIMAMCAYETAAYGYSRFCELFTEKEWYGYEYRDALEFWGDASLGSAVGAAQGVGWLKELQARLEGHLLTEPYASVNVTITGSEETFPLDQLFYMDMTHDTIILAILTALGLPFGQLPSTTMLQPRLFVASRLTPFGARLYVELIDCPEFSETMVRLKLNGRVVPLLGVGECPENEDGFCSLTTFIDALRIATEKVDYENACFGIPRGWENAPEFHKPADE